MNQLKNIPSFHNFYLYHRGTKYGFNSVVLAPISEKVRKAFFSGTYMIEIPPIEGNFQDFVDVIYGEEIIVDQTNCRFLHFISQFLGIEHLEKITKQICKETSTLNNLLTWADCLLQANQDATKEIDFIASHLNNVYTNPFFKFVSCDLVYSIISSSKQNMLNVNKISFIDSLIDSNPEKFQRLSTLLFTEIQSETDVILALQSRKLNLNLNRETIKLLLNTTKPNPPQQTIILAPKLNNLCGAIKYVDSLVPPDQRLESKVTAELEISNDQIQMSASSVFNTQFSLKNLLDPVNSTSYCSRTAENEYIMIHFKKAKLQINSYVIRSDINATKGICPKTWILEGSNDCVTWLTIDEAKNDKSLMGKSVLSVFPVKTKLMPLSYFKFTQLATNHNKNKKLFLSYIDLFGTLYQTNQE